MYDGPENIVHTLGRTLIRLLFRLEIVGLERVPPGGPLIMMNNHINFTDVSLILMLLPRRPVGFAKRELLHWPLVGWIISSVGIIGVRRGEVDRQAIRTAEAVLAEGRRALMVAPEGTRSGHGRLQPARDGVALIAARTGATVVPVAISGQEGFWRNALRLRKTRARIAIGEPFRLDAHGQKPDRAMLAEMTREAMYRLARQLPPDYRGTYADLENAKEDYITLVNHA